MTKTHEQHSSALYRTWLSIKSRCHNPIDKLYPNYGGKGITMDESWRKSFIEFYNGIGFMRPSRHAKLHRLDQSKGYYKDNLEWREYQIKR